MSQDDKDLQKIHLIISVEKGPKHSNRQTYRAVGTD